MGVTAYLHYLFLSNQYTNNHDFGEKMLNFMIDLNGCAEKGKVNNVYSEMKKYL